MAEASKKGLWGRRLSWLALALSLGGIAAALVAALGTGAGWWTYRAGLGVLRYALYAAVAGGVLAIVAWIVSRRSGARTGWINALALVAAVLFTGYLGNQIMTARSVPAIHDAATDLDDLPQFSRLTARADNLENIPDEDDPKLAALDPESRWKALHRRAYSDLRPLRLALPTAEVVSRAEQLARERGWEVANVDGRAGIVEATATTLFFRFKDDVVIRVRPDPAQPGGSIVDMRSISRVGGSDVGVNAARIRDFLRDLQASAA
ncbi:MAG: hypothetical protein AVDCRST_MAG09-1629 [uncultured Sphingomonas sp.]|uniref:DUF1499 domain-containing protein n=1 Tax=uncultured Sphingomonas sp. TaxID=158754 RepID=A0A6J4T5U9_9SPHN|nr:DUF1499 domain-containing protein [uncultured Sphingomonas sp.]CAA9514915.1 MAG: hypothetical protein AVDCRST_MAG09-1629 [uncultured Sphingomonas sp.]